MNILTDHPHPDELARLLHDENDAPEAIAEHLAECAECRAALERQAMGENGWLLDVAPKTEIGAPAELLDSLRTLTAFPVGETLARLETLPDSTVEELLPDATTGTKHRIGPYEILGVVGRGGMGIVLQGHDVVLRRTVALKIPTLAMRGDPVARGRFLREGRAAASITHPNVVPMLAVEEYAGVPVLVMPFVQGESLQQRLDRDGTIPLAEALRIALEISLALGAAHEKGLVHRDVKPANILLESPSDGVRLTDFGLARAADDARLTQTGLGAGTPLYMSPEQARGESVDSRADLFALGSVLFTMVTGKAPFAMPSLMGTLRRLADGSPASPRSMNPAIPPYVESLIMDLLKNSPGQRPANAASVSERIRECIQHVVAGTEPPRQRRRRRVLTIAGLFFAAALATAGTVLKFPTAEGILVVEIDDPEATVVMDRDGKQVSITGVGLKEIKLKLGQQSVRIEGKGQVREELVNITREGKTVLRATLEPVNSPPQIGFRAKDPKPNDATEVRIQQIIDRTIKLLDQTPNSQWLNKYTREVILGDASRKQNPTDAELQQIIDRTIKLLNNRPMSDPLFQPTPEGRLVPSIPGSGSIVLPPRTQTPPIGIPAVTTPNANVFTPRSGIPTPKWEMQALWVTDRPVRCVAVSPDGKRLASASTWPLADGLIRIWNTETGKNFQILEGSKGDIPALMYAKDGSLISSSEDGVIRFWDDKTGKETRKIEAHKGLIIALAISPDGKLIASAGADLAIQIREYDTGKVVKAFVGGKNRIRTLAFSPDGKQLMAGGEDEMITQWDVATGRLQWSIETQGGWVEKVAFFPNGKHVVACSRQKTFVADAESGKIIRSLTSNMGGATDVQFSPDGKTFATCGNDGRIYLYSPGDKIESMRISEGNANQMAFTSDGRSIYVGCGGRYDNAAKTFTPIGLGVQRVDLEPVKPVNSNNLPLGTPLNPNELRRPEKK